ncbi:unnamed protein product [Cyclocybe aegerita]|uniref:Uncharacterized protein n=1 Tax=Cyclocybe aegerita TaxID=1973307 RepID=A0A8S0WKQ8_CYCAE|nr:unnamed protein product [Cyclocybe aegerita]
MADPLALAPLLRCPVCHDTQRAPTTLHCGHSLCHHHLDAPSSSCPVAAYVTLNKVIALIDRTTARLDDLQTPDTDAREDDDDDDDPVPSTSARTLDRRNSGPRPRKRHKHSHNSTDEDDDEPDLLSHLRSTAARDRLVPRDIPLIPSHPPTPPPASRDTVLAEFDKKLLDELTCHICYLLFYQPVTTPCQHTYCAKCLQRSLDHSTTCPICRQDLPSYFFQDQPVNRTILAIILKAYSLLYQERGAAIEEEERHARLNTPIFVSHLTFPGMPTFLHFFEPRYRLMLRRCLETSNPRFGMIMTSKAGSPNTDYGTILEIRSVQMLPDGRSMVETWGSTRFRILERGSLDGYMVGRIESIYDYPDDISETLVLDDADEESPAPNLSPRQDQPLLRRLTSSLSASSSSSSSTRPRQPTNAELISTCRSFLDRLQRGAAPWVVQRLSTTYGAMPSDPALFSFWVALVLPIEEQEKAKLLPIRSARLRLMLVVHWIEQLNGNWYAWLRFVLLVGWWDGGRGPLVPCLVWTMAVLIVFRLIGWV